MGVLSEPRPSQWKNGVNNVKTVHLPAFVVNSTWNLRVDALYVSIIRLAEHCNAPVAFCALVNLNTIIRLIIAIIDLLLLFFLSQVFLLTLEINPFADRIHLFASQVFLQIRSLKPL